MKSVRQVAWAFLLGLGGCGGSEDVATSGAAATSPVRDAGSAEQMWFREIARSAGIDFRHRSGHATEYYTPEVVTGGVALLDADDDGYLDVYLVQAGSLTAAPDERPGNQLYRNLGDGRFADITAGSGSDDRGYGIGAATGDCDNDGRVDIYVTNVGRNVLLHNQGEGRFTDVTDKADVGDPGFGSSAAFVDYDVDGDLDLFVANYLIWSTATEKKCFNTLGQRDYCSPAIYNAPAVDVLYHNEGDGTFTDVTRAAGMAASFGTGLGVVCGDYTDDGRVDVFVANDGRLDQLWVNLGGGHFEDRSLLLGCAMDQDGKAKAGMGVTSADIDDDGDLDLLVCNLRRESDSLFLNEGTHFRDATGASGLGLVSRAFTRFGIGWVDFDNDGYLDLYQANGRVATDVDGHDPDDPLAEPNLLFRGVGRGRFEELSPRGGTSIPLIHTSRGAAFGDLDNDGGIDIFVANRDAPPYVLENVVQGRGNWLLVRVLDEHGRDDLGATVTIRIGDRTVRRDVRTTYSYCAASDPRVHFGLGGTSNVEALEIGWPDGTLEEVALPAINRVVEVRRNTTAGASTVSVR